jgi:Protein of unknown function (DUF2281)
MIDDATLEKVKSFPPQYQDEVRDFIEFLAEKKSLNIPLPQRTPGIGKGAFTYMAADFDEPIDITNDEKL